MRPTLTGWQKVPVRKAKTGMLPQLEPDVEPQFVQPQQTRFRRCWVKIVLGVITRVFSSM